MQLTHIVSVYVTLLPLLATADNILFFFGGGSYSHKHSIWELTVALAERGHNVTFLSAYEKRPSDHPNINDIVSKPLNTLMSKSYDIDRFKERVEGKQQDILLSYSKNSAEICETILLRPHGDRIMEDMIKNGKFDLVIINVIFGECGFILAHKYNAKVIAFGASVPLPWFSHVYGYIKEAAWIPDIIDKYDNFPLSFTERLKNWLWDSYWWFDRYHYMYPAMDKIMKKALGSGTPSFYELEKNASLVFTNTHHSFDFAHSLPPFVIPMGGINTLLPEKEIPKQYKDFLDGSGPEGAVFISFGSTIRLEKVSGPYSKMFFEVIKKHKNVRFLLKWEGPFPEGFEAADMRNLMVSPWVPQREILRHPKLKAFVTHGGLNSIQEATYYGVPLVVLPLFSDQDYNAYRIEAQEIGFRIEIQELSTKVLDSAITSILREQRYKKNMEVKSKLFRDRPQSPLETCVYWTEFVLRHDDMSPLKLMNDNLNWFQKRLLDVYIFCFAIVFVATLAIFIIVSKLCSLKNSKSQHSHKNSSQKLKKM